MKEFQIVKYLFVIFYFWVVIFFEEGDLTAGVHTSSIEDCAYALLSNDSVYARIGTVDSGENRIGKSFKMAALYQKRVDTFPKLG